ncbi:hypothetical protein [Pseudobacteriovorax antillogorgiicola]|uniref:Uncharacterized protein n=1 Tax=Pseudobacteriovorax antillogorgiicola TaxID=1513793 RepID=A0A1Y6CA52_9BACT|nr:hypothetical protein [Pseudobacteriovorax antillogorgiicola]TCS49904.1 hypothetical protein EDD56_114149 [Pseudobacteriovorax antillogorgiicola]SMF44820.1 hypothetical protein SAMN06296036_113154 [Pseudobacteriovorax antillogorgiicola]
MEILLVFVPIYLFISLVAFYKWLKLSVTVSTMESEHKLEIRKLETLLEDERRKATSSPS